VAWLFNCSAAAWRCTDRNAYLKESTNSEVRFSSPVFSWRIWRCCQTCAAEVKWYVRPHGRCCASITEYSFSMKNDLIFLNVVSAVVCTGTNVCPSLVNRLALAIKCHFIRKGNANILSCGVGCKSCHAECSELRFGCMRVSDLMVCCSGGRTWWKRWSVSYRNVRWRRILTCYCLTDSWQITWNFKYDWNVRSAFLGILKFLLSVYAVVPK
jgi:hypothetical protein